ncbi:DUF4153 domain-containing protein [Lysobacter sp. GX 14042]|uniref:DUF4153 domain-containing protein n=1 Tax=Lysobacter sp. GX 14042 TaxID=2907155 RepID=UPI001F1D7F8B|nr:DUF4153 domain-containing protein [Lysobacter sp. GX 14042]MCE7032234.1 DUF4153 domain-containing protein [Lysobacter sp. GX 14042]
MPTRSEPPAADDAALRLEPQVRAFIVLLALLQGLALWLVHLGGEQGWPLLDTLGPRVCWYTLVLSVPTAMALSVRRLDEARFWQHAALIAVVYLALSAWAAHAATGAPGLEPNRILTPFAAGMAAALFVAGPFLQCRQEHGRWCAPYPELFAHAWQNALTLVVAAVFTGLCWAVLGLWGGLFKLIGVGFFADLFTSRPFVYLGTGVIVGLGVLVGRSQSKPVRVLRRLLFAIFTGLFPLLAAIALLFVATLPFTGLAPLWGTRSAATVLMSLVLAMVVFANAVYQDGDEPPPYPRALRLLALAGLVVLPVFAVLALVALGLRISQYGWSVDRLWGVLAACVLCVHAFGYAWAALSRRGPWLARLEPVNVTAALLGVALVLLANSPVLDPQRIAAHSQVQRLLDGRTDAGAFDVDYLRFLSGRAGYRALSELKDAPRVQADAALLERIDRALQRQYRYLPWGREAGATIDDVAQARDLVRTSGAVPEDWWPALLGDAGLDSIACLQPGSDCIAIARDLDGDGAIDMLLCNLGAGWAAGHCRLHARQDGSWVDVAALVVAPGEEGEVQAALRRGEVGVLPRRWPDLEVGGQRVPVDAPSP